MNNTIKKTPPKATVILLHGILRSKTDMLRIERALQKRGYDTLNILYPSRKKSLEALTDFIHDIIINQADKSKTLHFVSHSMGGLLIRYYIERHTPKNLGRVVMLAPPNTGSELADYLMKSRLFAPLYKKTFGPAGQKLTTDTAHIDGGTITYPTGIIAGDVSINLLAPIAMRKDTVGEHDGIVPIARTKIDGMTDHITMKSTHTFMMFNQKVIHQILYFLKHEKFKR